MDTLPPRFLTLMALNPIPNSLLFIIHAPKIQTSKLHRFILPPINKTLLPLHNPINPNHIISLKSFILFPLPI